MKRTAAMAVLLVLTLCPLLLASEAWARVASSSRAMVSATGWRLRRRCSSRSRPSAEATSASDS